MKSENEFLIVHFSFFIYCLGRLVPSVDDTLEVSSLQRSATDKATVDVRLSEELRSVRSLARTTIEDSCIVSSLCTVNLSYARTDECVDFLCLLSSSGLTDGSCGKHPR